MIDPEIAACLRDAGIRFCLIGAQALARHGVVRFTADADLLVMNARVLSRDFWPPALAGAISALRRGDGDDPLAGVVRFTTRPQVDLLVGRGEIMRAAVDNAVHDGMIGAPVATPLDLVLLKLEAGGPLDLGDIINLVEAQREIAPGVDLVAAIDARAQALSDWGKRAWARVRPDIVVEAHGPG